MKLYYFTGDDGESGVFVGSETWREARNYAITHECMDDREFIQIRGHMCRENGKTVHTEIKGEHDAQDLMKAGYTNFWWMGDCEKCGKWSEQLNPSEEKLLCYECRDGEVE